MYDSSIVNEQAVAAIQEDAERHEDYDLMIEDRFNFMRSVRSEVNGLHDEKWPMAKRRMTFPKRVPIGNAVNVYINLLSLVPN